MSSAQQEAAHLRDAPLPGMVNSLKLGADMSWVIVVAVLIVIGIVLEREIYFYEGVHLGPRVQSWLYDRWSRKYDQDKRESQRHDDKMLARPLLDALSDVPEPFILDFATGTGRLSYALMSRPEFKGRIVALDLSLGMLEQAAAKLGLLAELSAKQATSNMDVTRASTTGQVSTVPPFSARVEWLRHQSLPLPFPDAAFDVVCALEVLELFPNMNEPLAEVARVLRPGGLLLTSRGTEESGRKAKVKSKAQLTALLEDNGFEDVLVTEWWKFFDRVIALKMEFSQPVGVRKLSDVLRCPGCKQIQWHTVAGSLKCQNCGKELQTTKEGIVLN